MGELEPGSINPCLSVWLGRSRSCQTSPTLLSDELGGSRGIRGSGQCLAQHHTALARTAVGTGLENEAEGLGGDVVTVTGGGWWQLPGEMLVATAVLPHVPPHTLPCVPEGCGWLAQTCSLGRLMAELCHAAPHMLCWSCSAHGEHHRPHMPPTHEEHY